MKMHYAKVISLCTFIFLFVNMGLTSTSFGVYQPYLVELPYVGNTGGSLILSTRTFTSMALMMFADRFYHALGYRRGVTLATLCSAVGFVLYALAPSFPVLIAGAIFAGAGYGLGGMIAVTVLVKRWYASGRGGALGFASVSTGIAAMIIPLVAVQVIAHISLSVSFMVEAALSFAVAAVVFALLRNRPSDKGLEPLHDPAAEEAGSTRVHAHKPKPMPDGARRLFLLAVVCVGGVCMSSNTYLSVYLTTQGYDGGFAAGMLSLAAVSLTASKALTGRLFDRMSSSIASLIMFGCQVSGLILLIAAGSITSIPLVACGALLASFGLVLGTIGVSEWSLELVPRRNAGKFVKDCQVAYVVGGLAGNFIPGPISDVMGSYQDAYGVFLLMAVSAMVIVAVTYKRYRVPV